MSLITDKDYADYIRHHSDEFLSFVESGYSTYFFPAYYYKLWSLRNDDKHIELWGNMGPHLVSSHVQQFSEVNRNDNCRYISNIYIFEAWGSRRRVQTNHQRILDHARSKEAPLPYKIIIIRNELERPEEDPNSPDISSLFPDIDWHKSINAIWDHHKRCISIGVLEQ